MEVNATFDSWDEFEIKFNEFRDSTFQPLFCFNQVRTIDYANQNLKGDKKYKSELKYKNVDIQCVHYGTYSSKAHQVRKVFFSLIIDI
jgi:hypothetical protein